MTYKRDPRQLADDLCHWLGEFVEQPRRLYDDPWSDWPGGSTGIAEPVAYALWVGEHSEVPAYVGQTTNLGSRLASHFSCDWSETKPTHVSYLAAPAFVNEGVLSAFERFLMAVWEPEQNDLLR